MGALPSHTRHQWAPLARIRDSRHHFLRPAHVPTCRRHPAPGGAISIEGRDNRPPTASIVCVLPNALRLGHDHKVVWTILPFVVIAALSLSASLQSPRDHFAPVVTFSLNAPWESLAAVDKSLAGFLNFVGIRTYADLHEAEVAQRPDGWDGKDWSKVRRTDLSGRNLAFADLRQAFLANTDLQQDEPLGRDPVERRASERLPQGSPAARGRPQPPPSSKAPTSAGPAPGRRPEGAHLQGGNLTGAHLQGADLSGAHLQGANLARPSSRAPTWSGAQLQGANLRGAQLQGADFSSLIFREKKEQPSSRAPT